jgi:hydroxymethylbilane synthase
MTLIRVATGGGPVALAQAGWVSVRLGGLGLRSELVVEVGDSERLREALLAGRADLAVHAFEELPATPRPDLELAAVPERADAREVLLIRPGAHATDAGDLPLRLGTRVGCATRLRQQQLLQLRPDLDLSDPGGDTPERIVALRAGDVDAQLIAAADLERLGLSAIELATSDLEVALIGSETLVPAPGQGALALEIRRDDAELAGPLTDLHHPAGYRAVAAERGLLTMLAAAGDDPVLGAHATVRGGQVALTAWYLGRRVEVTNPSSEGAAMLAFEALGRPDRSH